MTKANECTCPSGDGSLRHPCPAHPASVELAGVAANLTFINGRPAMCGCQVEYSSGGGEYSDVIYVTLCAKHSGSAILDLVATNRIALTPEYEGQWHADLYLDREIPLAKAEGATPAEAVLALMSAERIDPEQESVEQAGGDERAAFEAAASKLGIYTCNFERYTEETAAHENRINARVEDPVRAGDYRSATLQDCWKVWQEARAALAQHSPAPTLRAAIDIANDRFEAPVAKWGTDLAGEEERPEIEEVSEFEREDIARSAFETAMADGISLDSFLSLSNTLAARYERIVGALRFERQQMDRAFTACINERDAANARLHEVATACATAEQERDAALAKVAGLELKLDQSDYAYDNDRCHMRGLAKQAAEAIQVFTGHDSSANLAHRYGEKWWEHLDELRDALLAFAKNAPVAQPEEMPGEILAAKLIETWVTKHGKPAPWSTAVEITAVATNMPNDERDRLLALDDDVDAQAQHSVPDDVETFLDEVRAELLRARSKFPGDRIMTIALAEEFGELCKAVLDEPAANVRKEAVQTAVMAARVVLDGDGSVTAWRAERGLDPLASAPGKEGL
ncbi:TPA: hypothetical protein VDU60_000137 [Pseudomonas aeruginosa]|uniref:hypothetical protein n=2 Tax=Pseudomonas aeruginosa TaxID=287 RepID=UPI00244A060E|nr:hypothetical protein [Pseudomonas aeruginosa]MDG9825736.1 hypothetical protein [Pseudomonas aeruginosa]MDH0406936.1 hypothetical protein [Pseudomonas aeruginosa]MDH1019379.1 hypothetical protein [Pseudomonas aeruginosa]HBO3097136.1 hypothetical protein [Pseudomonas aeruginosa]HCL4371500.1 hypothetical protein [Pseudomonas aeruginosa]